MNKKLIISIIIKIIAIISCLYGIIKTSYSPLILTYFTTLSNIFISIMLFIFLIKDMCLLIKKEKIVFNNYLYITKFLATISITLTFGVFLVILAPTFEGGIISAYLSFEGGSFCLHFITPILAIVDFLVFDNDYKSKNSHALYAVIPPLLYVLFIVILSSSGLRWGKMSAPYNFLNFGAPTGWLGFDLSLYSFETLGIGVFYMIILLSVIFIFIGIAFLNIRKKYQNT